MSYDTPEAARLQRKLSHLTAQLDLVQSAFSDLRREISNVASAAWDAVEAAALAEQGETEWEYIAQFGHVRGEERITAEAAIQSAREVLDDYPLDFPESELPLQVLRRPLARWLPVPDTTNNESEGKA